MSSADPVTCIDGSCLPTNSPGAQHLWWDDQPYLWLALHGWADCDVADLDVVGLFDGKGNGAGDGRRSESEFVHASADLLADAGVVDGRVEFSADKAG